MPTPTLVSLVMTPGWPADGETTLRQMGYGVTPAAGGGVRIGHLLANGAHSYVKDDEAGWVRFGFGLRQRKLYCVVRLDENDTYSMEIGRIKRGTFEVEVLRQTSNLYAEDIGPQLTTWHGEIS